MEKKKHQADRQLTNLAGEFFVAAELLKRGLQTSVTFGNAKAIDLLSHNRETGKTFTVQVKALRRKNYFPLKQEKLKRNHIYVFAILNKTGHQPEYFIVPGHEFLKNPSRFGKDFGHPKFPGILPKYLEDYRESWSVFEQP